MSYKQGKYNSVIPSVIPRLDRGIQKHLFLRILVIRKL